jgi:hypothetical protein
MYALYRLPHYLLKLAHSSDCVYVCIAKEYTVNYVARRIPNRWSFGSYFVIPAGFQNFGLNFFCLKSTSLAKRQQKH